MVAVLPVDSLACTAAIPIPEYRVTTWSIEESCLSLAEMVDFVDGHVVAVDVEVLGLCALEGLLSRRRSAPPGPRAPGPGRRRARAWRRSRFGSFLPKASRPETASSCPKKDSSPCSFHTSIQSGLNPTTGMPAPLWAFLAMASLRASGLARVTAMPSTFLVSDRVLDQGRLRPLALSQSLE